MSGPDVARMLVRLPSPTSLDGIRLGAAEVRCVDVGVIRTLPAYRATEIQHDLKLFRDRNMKIYSDLELSSPRHHPSVEDIATPIYFISRIHEGLGEIAYVGKAQSQTSRFVGGHIALLKLLDPEYKDYDKFISFAVMSVRTFKGDVVPVEWIENKELRDGLIRHVEHSLVWKIQPVYNTHYKSEEPKDFTFELNLYDHDGSYITLDPIRVRAAGAPIHQMAPEVRRGI